MSLLNRVQHFFVQRYHGFNHVSHSMWGLVDVFAACVVAIVMLVHFGIGLRTALVMLAMAAGLVIRAKYIFKEYKDMKGDAPFCVSIRLSITLIIAIVAALMLGHVILDLLGMGGAH